MRGETIPLILFNNNANFVVKETGIMQIILTYIPPSPYILLLSRHYL